MQLNRFCSITEVISTSSVQAFSTTSTVNFNDLRHTCASLLLSRGMGLKDVQEWMGHADIKMTADIYGHLDIARKQAIADQMAAIL